VTALDLSLPPIDQALLPASVRSGSRAAKNAYETALGFEEILVSQLSQELVQTASGFGLGGSGGGDGSDDGGSSAGDSGQIGSDPAGAMYSQLLPNALTSSVMSGGGLGIAQELAGALDPALGAKA